MDKACLSRLWRKKQDMSRDHVYERHRVVAGLQVFVHLVGLTGIRITVQRAKICLTKVSARVPSPLS